MSPTALTAALVAVLALLAFVLPVLPLLAAGVALLAAVAVDAGRVRRPPRVRRELPELLSLGVPAQLLIAVDAPRAAGVTIRQASPGDLRIEPAVARGRRLEAEVVARRRGHHELPPVAVRLRGPLGLAAWIHEVGETVAVDAFPDMPGAYRAAARARHARYRDPGTRGRGPLGLGTEFESVREYSPDDDIRQVNWRATQRLGRPMSNDFRLEQDRDVIAAIDAGRLMQAPLEDRSRLDAALDAVAALAATCDDSGDRFGVLAFDAQPRLWQPPARRGGRPALIALYDLEASTADSDYALAFERLTSAKRALVFVFTDLIEEVAARPLAGAMPVLGRRHAVTLVSPRDDELEAAVTGEQGEAESVSDALRAAVALEVLDARSRAAAVARAAGADVVEAPPGELAGAVVSAYLRAKTRARA